MSRLGLMQPGCPSRCLVEFLCEHEPASVLAAVFAFLDIAEDTAGQMTVRNVNDSTTQRWFRATCSERFVSRTEAGTVRHAVLRSPFHPLFEITCRLLFALRPSAVEPFIRLTALMNSVDGAPTHAQFVHYYTR